MHRVSVCRYHRHGYITVLSTQLWPRDRDMASFDHVTDFSPYWLPYVHTCVKGAQHCGAPRFEGDPAPFWFESSDPKQQCMGEQFVHSPMLQYTSQCQQHYAAPTFTVTHLYGSHEPTQNGIARMDRDLLVHVKRAVLEPTLVLVLGDHGPHYGEYSATR